MINKYIGITDFTSAREAIKLAKLMTNPRWGDKPPFKLMLGVMMTYKTLNDIPCRWLDIFPKRSEIQEIFTAHPLIYNCLHYADYEGHGQEVSRSISRAIELGGMDINAIQLDMIWPDPIHVAHGVAISRKEVDVILQIGKSAFEEVGNNPEQVVKKLWPYHGVIQGVLLDLSMGKGQPMESAFLLPHIKAIKEMFPKLHIAVAGGLGPGTVSKLLRPIFNHFEVSVDAQGRLRPSGELKDPVDWDMAKQYVLEVLELRQEIDSYFNDGGYPPPGWDESLEALNLQ